MFNPQALAQPLSDDDWDALSDVLDAPGGPSLDGCVGFLTAVATAPSHILPSQWLPMVLGERAIADEGGLGLVLRMFNAINQGLAEQSVFHPDADQAEEIEDWCVGYMMGVRLAPAWIGDLEAMTPVFPIAVLAGEQSINDPEDDDRIEDEAAWMQETREDLGDLAVEAYMVLAPARRALIAGRGGKAGEDGKPSRNSPCPCGSGKRYKRCCLGK